MADVRSYMRPRPRPRVEEVMSSLESICRTHDTTISRVIWMIVFLVIWMVVADSVVTTSTVVFNGTWPLAVTENVPEPASRAQLRTLHRVSRALADHCQYDDSKGGIVLGPQVYVDDKPYMYRIMRICNDGTELVNPRIVVRGSQSGLCDDEHNGEIRRETRYYPITIHSSSSVPYTLLELGEVCTFVHALRLLDAQW